MHECVVYKICNSVNNNEYVGSTKQKINICFSAHKRDVKNGSKQRVHKLMRRFGIEKFYIKELETKEVANRQEQLKLETEWRVQLNSILNKKIIIDYADYVYGVSDLKSKFCINICGILPCGRADKYFNILNDELKYESDEESCVIIRGKKINIPRKQVSYGDENLSYSFAGNISKTINWNKDDTVCKVIKNIKKRIESQTMQKFNYVLINRYDDGNNYIGYHHDKDKDLKKGSSIIGVSLGSEREMLFKRDKTVHKYSLKHGSMIEIKWNTNKNWKHSIPKRKKIKDPRISLTFRCLNEEDGFPKLEDNSDSDCPELEDDSDSDKWIYT